MKGITQRNAAFSLVEVVLALLVFAIGILSVLALFPGGLLLSHRAHTETYVAEFAEMALNTLGTELEINQNFWETNDAGFAILASNYVLSTAVPDDGNPWVSPPGVTVMPAYQTNEYRLLSDPTIVDRAFRYQLKIERTPGMMDELLSLPQIITTFTRMTNNNGQVFWITNMYYCINTSQLVRMDEHIIKAHLWIRPGLYGTDGERYFFRYYIDYQNKKRQGY